MDGECNRQLEEEKLELVINLTIKNVVNTRRFEEVLVFVGARRYCNRQFMLSKTNTAQPKRLLNVKRGFGRNGLMMVWWKG